MEARSQTGALPAFEMESLFGLVREWWLLNIMQWIGARWPAAELNLEYP